jgi:hypothetical protein
MLELLRSAQSAEIGTIRCSVDGGDFVKVAARRGSLGR